MNRSLLQSVLRRVEVQSANGPRSLGDLELLRKYATDRDEAAFTVLVARHGPLVWAVCRNILANEPEAEDAFQATFLALVQSAHRIRTPAIGAWLHGVAVRAAKMAMRSSVRRRQRERKAASSESSSPIASLTWNDLQSAVHEEVSRLPEPLRLAFVLCNLQGKRQSDAAAELGWKTGTLSGRLSQPRRQLLERLAKRGVATTSVVAAVVAGGSEAIAGAPPALIAKVGDLADRAFEIGYETSSNLLQLARAATEVTMTRTKLLGIAAAVTGVLIAGFTLLPFGSAQEKKQPLVPAAGASKGKSGDSQPGGGASMGMPGMPGMPTGGGGSGRSANAAWEYKYVIRQSNRLEDFQNLLSSNATSGWEYIGTESLQVTDTAKKTDLGSAPILVFKRPTAGRSGTSSSSTGMGGFSGSGFSGMGGFGGNPFGSMSNRREQPKAPAGGDAAPMGVGSPMPVRREPQIIALKNVTAITLAKSLQDLFHDGATRIVAEQQTNSLLIQADKDTYEVLAKLVARLDVPATRKSP